MAMNRRLYTTQPTMASAKDGSYIQMESSGIMMGWMERCLLRKRDMRLCSGLAKCLASGSLQGIIYRSINIVPGIEVSAVGLKAMASSVAWLCDYILH